MRCRPLQIVLAFALSSDSGLHLRSSSETRLMGPTGTRVRRDGARLGAARTTRSARHPSRTG